MWDGGVVELVIWSGNVGLSIGGGIGGGAGGTLTNDVDFESLDVMVDSMDVFIKLMHLEKFCTTFNLSLITSPHTWLSEKL